jgi:mannosyltransferase OCH1-like enzyme
MEWSQTLTYIDNIAKLKKITNKKYINVKALKMQHQPENMIPKNMIPKNMIPKNMIPKNIILTYKTKNVDEFPEFYRLCFERMVEFFNDYEIKIFDDTDMDVLVRSFDSKLYEVYQQCEIIRKTDIFRLVALHVYGGIYMDLDVYLEKNPKSYIEQCDKSVILCIEKLNSPTPFSMYKDHHMKYVGLANYFIASAPKTKFLYDCLHYILIINTNTKVTVYDNPFSNNSKHIIYTGNLGGAIAVNYVNISNDVEHLKYTGPPYILCTTGPCLVTK